MFSWFIRPVKKTQGSGHVGLLTCLAVVLQLDLLEDQRKKILSRCAFSIQCCWRRYQRHRRHTRQRSATLIQAGKLWPGQIPLSGNGKLCGANLTVWSTGSSWQSLNTVLTGWQNLSPHKLPDAESHLINSRWQPFSWCVLLSGTT